MRLPRFRWLARRAPDEADALVAPSLPRLDRAATDPPEQLTLGRHWAHDTETPDVETASDRYASRFSGAVGQWLLHQQTQSFERVLAGAAGERLHVLELGAGHAQIAPLLLARGHSVVAHGSTAACFERLAPFAAQHPGRLQFVVSDLRRLPFADATFDLVVAVRLFGHVRGWRALTREMARVSRRYVVVEYARAGGPLLRPLGEAVFWLKRVVEGTTRPFFAYDERTMQQSLDACGLRPVASTAQFAVPMVVHRLLGRERWSAGIEAGLRRIGLGDSWRSPVIALTERPPVRSPR